MSMTEYPDNLVSYCIDNKLTIKDGLQAMIEDKFKAVETGLKELKREVVREMSVKNKSTKHHNHIKITDDDVMAVEEFLRFLNDNNNGTDEK